MPPETEAERREAQAINSSLPFSSNSPLLKGIHIFRAGDYSNKKKGKWTEADLQKIADNFSMLKAAGEHEPPLKSSHEDDNRGNPVLGWAEKVYAVGKDLFADFRLVSEKVKELIKQKAFRFRSAELHDKPRPWTRPDGSHLANVLRAVSFVPIPEVKGMEEITATLSDTALGYISLAAGTEEAVAINFQGDSNMPETAEEKKKREDEEKAAAAKMAADEKAKKEADEKAAAAKLADEAAAKKAADDAAVAKAADDAAAAAAVKAADEKKKEAFSDGPITISAGVQFSADDMKIALDDMTVPQLKEMILQQSSNNHESAFEASTKWVDDKVQEGKILPKMRDIALGLDNPNLAAVAKVPYADGKEPLPPNVLFRMFVEGSPVAVKMNETAGQKGANSDQDSGVNMSDSEAKDTATRIQCGKTKEEWADMSDEDKKALVEPATK